MFASTTFRNRSKDFSLKKTFLTKICMRLDIQISTLNEFIKMSFVGIVIRIISKPMP